MRNESIKYLDETQQTIKKNSWQGIFEGVGQSFFIKGYSGFTLKFSNKPKLAKERVAGFSSFYGAKMMKIKSPELSFHIAETSEKAEELEKIQKIMKDDYFKETKGLNRLSGSKISETTDKMVTEKEYYKQLSPEGKKAYDSLTREGKDWYLSFQSPEGEKAMQSADRAIESGKRMVESARDLTRYMESLPGLDF